MPSALGTSRWPNDSYFLAPSFGSPGGPISGHTRSCSSRLTKQTPVPVPHISHFWPAAE